MYPMEGRAIDAHIQPTLNLKLNFDLCKMIWACSKPAKNQTSYRKRGFNNAFIIQINIPKISNCPIAQTDVQ